MYVSTTLTSIDLMGINILEENWCFSRGYLHLNVRATHALSGAECGRTIAMSVLHALTLNEALLLQTPASDSRSSRSMQGERKPCDKLPISRETNKRVRALVKVSQRCEIKIFKKIKFFLYLINYKRFLICHIYIGVLLYELHNLEKIRKQIVLYKYMN